ncbi:MAG: hypothetical protein P3C10_01485 [Gemmatimonadota bacterium]|nr:hypothetical protein [Gemmatimonadota bacterium]
MLILSVGIAIGYGYGWKDAHVHEQHIVERTLDRIGGETRDRMGNDVDGRFKTADGK